MHKRRQILAWPIMGDEICFFSAVKLFKYLVIKILHPELDPEPDQQFEKMLGPGPKPCFAEL
jgi:hypothetical protein